MSSKGWKILLECWRHENLVFEHFNFPPQKKESRKFLPTIQFDLSWTYSQPKVTRVAFLVCALNVFEIF